MGREVSSNWEEYREGKLKSGYIIQGKKSIFNKRLEKARKR